MDNPLIVGSIKSNLGDSEATSGLSGLIKIVLSIEEGSIPGTPSYSMPSSKVSRTEPVLCQEYKFPGPEHRSSERASIPLAMEELAAI